MKIKTKLSLGVGVLFAMVALLTIIGGIYVTGLSSDTKNILVDNYNTLDFSRQMLVAVNGGLNSAGETKVFEQNLTQQEKNVTEPGEKELTQQLAIHYDRLKLKPTDSALVTIITTDLTNIMLLNMQAIQRKSAIAQKTADQAIFWIVLAGTICFIISFVMLLNLPSNVADPLKELTDSIKEIAGQNYTKRLSFQKHNEFGDLSSAFNTMAQKLEEYKSSNIEKLMIEKKRIDTLINNMADPVIGLDQNNRILFMNNVALKISGLQGESVVGKTVQDVAMKNDLVRTLVQDLFITGNDLHESKRVPIKIYADSKESYFEKEIIPINILPTGEKVERLIGNVIMLQNITPYKELDFAKTNFIATVSHELKTPISAIKMSLQLLRNEKVGSLNEEQENLIDSIRNDTERLLKITGELLNMSQVESGNIQLNITPSDPRQILDYAVNATRTQADQKQVRMEISSTQDLPMVEADSEKTAWVITNLLSNAIRYSYDKSVIKLVLSSQDGKISFKVQDFGQGISPEYKDKIFDRYFRVPGTKKDGTGLGLAISKEFIEAQGGSISVDSDYGAGSTFTVSLNSFATV